MDSPQQLIRPRDGRMVAGVCAGIARRFGVDATLVRLAWVFSVLCLGTGVLVYIICWIVIPEE